MKLIIFLFFTSFNLSLAGESCVEAYSPINTLTEVLGKKCLAEIETEKLKRKLKNTEVFKSFCEDCNNKVMNGLSEDKTARDERASMYGKATLDELQKELTFITHELLLLRSTYKIEFNSKKTGEHCSVRKNIKPPKCVISPTQQDEFKIELNKIEASLATDIAAILKPEETSNKCGITDREILFVNTKFQESLITPDLIESLRKIKLSADTNIEELFSEDHKRRDSLQALKGHPLFKVLISNPERMNQFLKKLGPNETNGSMVEKLYKSDISGSFGDNIKKRCQDAYDKTNEFLNSIYCDKKAPFVADDFTSLQLVFRNPIAKQDPAELEGTIQTICSHNNLRTDKTKSFSEIQKAINGTNPLSAKEPISSFKIQIKRSTFDNFKTMMCDNWDTCKSAKEPSTECTLVSFLELSRTSPEYKELAKSSSEDINKVLGSMIGQGIPQVESGGKLIIDTVALKNLRDEGILPGGAPTTSTKTTQPDVATFQKKVSASAKQASNANTISKSTGQMAAPETKSANQISSPDFQNTIPETPSDRRGANNTPSKNTKETTRKFMNDNDEFMRRLKPNGPAAPKTKTVNNTNIQESSTTIDSSSPQTSFTATDIKDTASEKPATVINNFIRSPEPSSKKAVLDPLAKPKNITNTPLIEANEKRQLNEAALLASEPTSASTTGISPTSQGKPKVDTSIETTSVKEYQAKLQVLLNAQSKEISVEKHGESFLVKLKSYEIKVLFNKTKNSFEAICLDTKIPKAYLTRITDYFNKAVPVRENQRVKLLETLKASK